MKKILITGGAGFIGREITTVMQKSGYSVKSFDIHHEKKQSGVEYITGSILDCNALDNAMTDCETVIHLAAMLGVKRTEKQRLSCINVNVHGFQNVLESCVKRNIKKIIFSSSSEVYGGIYTTPIKENNQFHPQSIYATTKILGEEMLRAYSETYSFDYNIVRFFNVYGLDQVAEFVLPRFIRNVMDNIPPVIYGTGNQTRAFCYMDDAAYGVKLVFEKAQNTAIYNIGNNEEVYTMKDLAELVISKCNKNLKPIYKPLKEVGRGNGREIDYRVPCIEKAQNELGFNPQISLPIGVEKIIEKGMIPITWWDPINIGVDH